MEGKKLGKNGKSKSKGRIAKLRRLGLRAKEESDPAWRRWYEEIDRRRQELANLKSRPPIICDYEKDGREQRIVRRQSTPEPLKKIIKNDKKRIGSPLTRDLIWIREAWAKCVGEEIAAETEVHSFKNGVLVISVSSGTLLQEIRQFHGGAILTDLRDIWAASVPLLHLSYRLSRLDKK